MSEGSSGPMVSVLIATRNGARFLGEALASLRGQTWPHLEILAVDDGSTDDSPAILEDFARSHAAVRVLRTPGVGLAGALALAARTARGELLARHDDDDRSHPRRLECQVAFLQRRPDVSVLGTATEIIDADGAVTGLYPAPTEPGRMRRMLRRAPPFVHGSVVMRRETYERAGGYRAAFQAAQDYDLWLRLPPETGLANLETPLYQWRLHAGSVFSRARDVQVRYHALARALAEERRARGRDSIELLECCGGLDRFLAEYSRAGRLHFFLGEDYVREGRLDEARRHLGEALRHGGSVAATLQWLGLSWAAAWLLRSRRRRARGPA